MSANDTQVGGSHYKVGSRPEHWDLVLLYDWDYFQGQITKYLMRWKTKYSTPEKRLEDLKKAAHFLQKYIEHQQAQMGYAESPKGPETVQDIMKQELLQPNTPADAMKMLRESDAEFSCEGYRGELGLYQDRFTKKEYWAKNILEAHKMRHVERIGRLLEPSGGYVNQG